MIHNEGTRIAVTANPANERESLLGKLIDVAECFMRTLKGDSSTEAKALYNEVEALVDRMYRASRNAGAGGTMNAGNTE